MILVKTISSGILVISLVWERLLMEWIKSDRKCNLFSILVCSNGEITRPKPESFKGIDTCTCSENCINSPYICPRMHWDCPYEWWVYVIILDYKWVNWFTSVDQLFVELYHWNFRYISQFLKVGCGPVTVEMLPYPKIWSWDVNCINICSIQRYIHHHSVILIMWEQVKVSGCSTACKG